MLTSSYPQIPLDPFPFSSSLENTVFGFVAVTCPGLRLRCVLVNSSCRLLNFCSSPLGFTRSRPLGHNSQEALLTLALKAGSASPTAFLPRRL